MAQRFHFFRRGRTALSQGYRFFCFVLARYLGDQSDPRGGVRRIIPDKADYWTNLGKDGAP